MRYSALIGPKLDPSLRSQEFIHFEDRDGAMFSLYALQFFLLNHSVNKAKV